MKRRNRAQRLLRLTAVYLLLLPFLLLGWCTAACRIVFIWNPGRPCFCPALAGWNLWGFTAARMRPVPRVVGSYQTTLSLGGWLPIKNIRTVVTGAHAGHGLRYAVRGQNVLRGGADRWLFRY